MKRCIKRNQVKGFTLVELLSVIVILAVILVIAVPQIMNIIDDVKKASFSSTVKIIATEAEKKYVQNEVLAKEDNIGCENISKLNKGDYKYCNISMNDGIALVTLVGAGKFEGMKVLNGTKTTVNVAEDDGEKLYTLEDVYEMVNSLTSEVEKTKTDISKNTLSIDENSNNILNNTNKIEQNTSSISNMTNKDSDDNIFLQMYPVGSIYVNSTNTNPGIMFGGTWELVEKRFKNVKIVEKSNEQVLFTASENLLDYAIDMYRTGNNIRIRFKYTTAVELSDSAISLGFFNLNQLGVSSLGHSLNNYLCLSDAGNAVNSLNFGYNNGELTSNDVISRTSGSTIPAQTGAFCNFDISIMSSDMLDSAVSEFHFKRTS